jgi:hypothetical protein
LVDVRPALVLAVDTEVCRFDVNSDVGVIGSVLSLQADSAKRQDATRRGLTA